MTKTKEQLNEEFNRAKDALWKFEANEKKEKAVQLIGTCYKSLNRSCDGDDWPLYRKLVGYSNRCVFESFEISDRGDAEYSPKHEGFMIDEDDKISNEEYEKAFKEFVAYIIKRK